MLRKTSMLETLSALLAAQVACGLLAGAALGSSHREAPLITADPLADNVDTYAFVSPDDPTTVTIIANYIPLEEPAGGPNFSKFSDDVRYEINIDNDGDAKPDIRYRFTFDTTVQNPNTFLYNTGAITSLDDPDWNIRQSYTVIAVRGNTITRLGRELPTPPVNIGPTSTPNYESLASQAVVTLPGGIKAFCGQRDDPFFVDLGGIFDLLTIRVLPGDTGGGVDGVAGFNTHTIALQIPIASLTSDRQVPTGPEDPEAVIGVWASASRQKISVLQDDGQPPSTGGPFVQVSRLGMPLVNEVVIPLGDKDRWNNSEPKDDGQFLSYVTDPELAVLLNALYGLNVPLSGRDDLVAVFLTGVPGLNQPPDVVPSEQIRLNTAIAPTQRDSKSFSPLGLLGGNTDGFPNGRRLEDDVTDIELRAVAGVTYDIFHPEWDLDPLANRLGDGVDANDMAFSTSFPYVATPHQGFDHEHHGEALRSFASLERPSISLVLQDGKIVVQEGVAKSAGEPAAAIGAIGEPVGQNFPNPFRESTRIDYRVPTNGDVTVEVIDVTGRQVRELVARDQLAGSYSIAWDGQNASGNPMPSGTYFYRVSAGGSVEARKMVLQR